MRQMADKPDRIRQQFTVLDIIDINSAAGSIGAANNRSAA